MLRLAEEDNSIYYTLRNIFFAFYLLSFIASIISYFYYKKNKNILKRKKDSKILKP
jgi:hypothetical protein